MEEGGVGAPEEGRAGVVWPAASTSPPLALPGPLQSSLACKGGPWLLAGGTVCRYGCSSQRRA
jgi:hypothetical protein